jgi:hypothetical protein
MEMAANSSEKLNRAKKKTVWNYMALNVSRQSVMTFLMQLRQ